LSISGNIGVDMRQKAVMVTLNVSPGSTSVMNTGYRLLALIVVLCWCWILNLDRGISAFGIMLNWWTLTFGAWKLTP
jgi:hypothetical protein